MTKPNPRSLKKTVDYIKEELDMIETFEMQLDARCFDTTTEKLKVIVKAVSVITKKPKITLEEFILETGLSVKKIDNYLLGFNFFKSLVIGEDFSLDVKAQPVLLQGYSNVYLLDSLR
ncbi:TPA: hypothetical protein NKO89_003241 [Vibrio parahaemolyticus]|uniref:hypothetical protein n=1 Tax=Vibrio vulnificus TaxID=672 RepID=UPI0019D484D1|nr:hypothetical protein [Vibrio vulnificus]MBN8144934.1 hypothetical protein [Vibrio vulnificus]HAS6161856.1 hypothetical protein [Vibrio vulnificus]HCH0719218.1 hypothetical protein [Vibrio parahaemolyticus]